jgi:endonuclease YncB( thermonuclease family)
LKIAIRTLALVSLVGAMSIAHAATLTGEVVAISDGDTLTLLDASKTQHRVRLAGIDAPEKRQAFGNRSKQSLTTLAFRRFARVDWNKTDRYGRIIGVVQVNGQDVGLEQIQRGMAWHYKHYEREQSQADRTQYSSAELRARAAQVGLWRDFDPQPPWDFRKMSRR